MNNYFLEALNQHIIPMYNNAVSQLEHIPADMRCVIVMGREEYLLFKLFNELCLMECGVFLNAKKREFWLRGVPVYQNSDISGIEVRVAA